MNPSLDPFITACWVVFFGYWFVAALWTKRTVEWGDWQSRWWVWLIIGLLLARRGWLQISSAVLWEPTPALGVVADLVTFAGLLVALWARTILGGNWSANVVLKERHELIERGPYRYVRHPIYSGVLLMILGSALLAGTTMGVMVLGIAAAGLWLKAQQEERLLSRHFPEAYERYRARVTAALVPRVI